jgi:hypothetical protein
VPIHGRKRFEWKRRSPRIYGYRDLSDAETPLGTPSGHSPGGRPDVLFIGARGSGETADAATHGMGHTVDYMAERMKGLVDEDSETMGFLPVVYAADRGVRTAGAQRPRESAGTRRTRARPAPRRSASWPSTGTV